MVSVHLGYIRKCRLFCFLTAVQHFKDKEHRTTQAAISNTHRSWIERI